VLVVPPAFAAQVSRRAGAAGQAWVHGLPALAERYARRWSLTADGSPMHGYAAVVLPVRRRGEPAVLKLTWLDEQTRDEPVALEHWSGAGAVRLLEHDADDGALLLERLNPHRSLAGEAIGTAVAVAAGLLRDLAVPAPPLRRSLRDEAARWVERLPGDWERLGRPLARRLLDAAVEVCRDRGPRAASLLVNEDLHFENVLSAPSGWWLVIDPNPLAGDPEFGVIPLLWNRMAESTLDERFDAVVGAARLDPDLARQWTLVRAVLNWLWLVEDGLTDDFVFAAVRRIAPWAAGIPAGESGSG
jgi:streptomycin 6-kinase